MNKWMEILLGLIFIIGAILVAHYSVVYNWSVWGISLNFRTAAWNFLKGGLFWFVVMMGLLLLMLGISDLKG